MAADTTPQTQRERDLALLARLRLMDDDFMTLVFDGAIEATELLLNIILERSDMEVLEVAAQREYKNPNPNGRSIKLDVYAKDRTGKVYDIEIQRADRGAGAQRARFNSSMIDARMLRAGEDFSKLADSYVIFITENDILGLGRALYHIERRIEENGAVFGDGSHILYVNGNYRDDSHPVGRLMHDFRCTKADDMFYPVLAAKVRHFKENEGGKSSMCKLLEDMRNETAEKATILATVSTYREFSLTDAEIVARLKAKFGLSDEKARDYASGKIA